MCVSACICVSAVNAWVNMCKTYLSPWGMVRRCKNAVPHDPTCRKPGLVLPFLVSLPLLTLLPQPGMTSALRPPTPSSSSRSGSNITFSTKASLPDPSTNAGVPSCPLCPQRGWSMLCPAMQGC